MATYTPMNGPTAIRSKRLGYIVGARAQVIIYMPGVQRRLPRHSGPIGRSMSELSSQVTWTAKSSADKSLRQAAASKPQ